METNKCMKLIQWRIDTVKQGMEIPCLDEFYWIPLSIEFSKNIDDTIKFLKSLSNTEFLYSLECLEETLERNPSKKLIQEIENTAKSKNIDMNIIYDIIQSCKDRFNLV